MELNAEGKLTPDELLRMAADLAWCRPIGPYPGWLFDCEWHNSSLEFQLRRVIWEHARRLRMPEPLLMEWHHGTRVRCFLGNDTSKQLYVGGCIDPNEFAFLDDILRPGMTFLDIGANEGLYSIFASRKVGESGEVWAFEPSPREFRRLHANLALNECANVEEFDLALGDREGEAQLAVAGFGHEGQNTLSSFVYDIEILERMPVAVHRLDEIASRKGLERLDVVKIDVEGSEVRVLKGASAALTDFRPVVIVEAHDRALRTQDNSVEELLELLRSFEYTVNSFDPDTGSLGPVESCQMGLNVVAIPT